jgi:hemerythrin
MQPTSGEDLGGAGKKVDDEHRLQVELIDAVEHFVRSGVDPAVAGQTLEQLAAFSEAHFRSEEMLMRLYAYAGRAAHEEEHRRFSDRLREIRDRVAGGDPSGALHAIGAWRASLVQHIQTMDWDFASSERAIKYVQNL